jgi:hypothetical protein
MGINVMNATTNLLEGEDLEGLVNDLKEWPNMAWGNEDERWSVSPFTTFYFLYDSRRWLEVSEQMIDIHREFERVTGTRYVTATHPDSERPHPYGSSRLPDLNAFVGKSQKDDHFLFKASTEKNPRWSPAAAAYFWRKPAYMNDREEKRNRIYSSIQFYYKQSWWDENIDVWRNLVLDVIKRLQPEFAYSGLTMATALEFGARSSTTVWERALTPRFFGLDIDSPWSMESHGDGIRPPTWGALLSDNWSTKLGLTREQVRDRLRHPDINLVDTANGLWVELGKRPSLYPVEDGAPVLQCLLNELLRPIRDDNIDLLGFPTWDDDPNERFYEVDSRRWLGRFDDDSDWPSNAQRRRASEDRVDMNSLAFKEGKK